MVDPNGKSSDAAIQGNEIWDNSSGDATSYGGTINTRNIYLWCSLEKYIQILFSLLLNKYWYLSKICRQYNIFKQLKFKKFSRMKLSQQKS